MTQSTSRQQAVAEATGNTSGHHYADCESVGACTGSDPVPANTPSLPPHGCLSSNRLCRVNGHPAASRDHQTGLAQLGQIVADRRLSRARHPDLFTSRRTQQIRHDLNPHRNSHGPSGGRGRFIGDAEAEVFDVVHGLIEEHRDVVVVKRVDHTAPVAGSGHQPHCAQKA